MENEVVEGDPSNIEMLILLETADDANRAYFTNNGGNESRARYRINSTVDNHRGEINDARLNRQPRNDYWNRAAQRRPTHNAPLDWIRIVAILFLAFLVSENIIFEPIFENVDDNQPKTKLENQTDHFQSTEKHRDSTKTSISYDIEVITGNVRFAGTDANVFIQIFGQDGKTKERKLDNSSNNFERRRVDRFTITELDVGKIQKIRIRHDNSKFGPGWNLDRVAIISKKNGKAERTIFVCRKWFSKKKGDKRIERELLPTDDSGNPI
ncbi:Oidioi.mRNA.OKI2018_I69.PAR.g10729.t1.cds [Oikopleura dioica]|uniref:Oidioi.mRNA.OKI2018_I69.PAR.g10729.t1.cds n=1 Tax=Oikopleura dioica TaxID=34765 RepID=A0ABN7RVB7_OIKDI|nr:Oidioi.mRNA.OKI2018_I69.PAR.g10729.t1.cds [Oikopleura dioica]